MSGAALRALRVCRTRILVTAALSFAVTVPAATQPQVDIRPGSRDRVEAAVAPTPAAAEAGAAHPLHWLRAPGTAVVLDPASRITLRVYRAGLLARLGHNHVVEAVDLDGRLWGLDDGGAVADLRLRVDRLRVDDPAARAAAGESFATLPGPAAIEATRRNLLGPQVLDAETWPEIRILARIDGLRVARSQAHVYFSLRGIGRRYQLPVSISHSGDKVSVSGSVALLQSELGITPFAALGGALKVGDQIDVDFHVIGRNPGPRL